MLSAAYVADVKYFKLNLKWNLDSVTASKHFSDTAQL